MFLVRARSGVTSARSWHNIDVANLLDFSRGTPLFLSVSNTDLLREQIQRAFPQVQMVKTLNAMNTNIMVNPALLSGDHDVFINGNNLGVMAQVCDILQNRNH